MSIDLTAYERGRPFSGDVAGALAALRERLAAAQLSQIVNRKRAIVVLEGPEGAGKTDVLRQLAAAFDPRFVTFRAILPDRRLLSEGHWLARFWADLPKAGHVTAFHHSWYGRVLEDDVLGMVFEKDRLRAYDEINEFEAQQRDHGTLIAKLFMHATDTVQNERLALIEEDPWKRHLLGPAQLRTSDARQKYREAVELMFEQNHTRWSPWAVIDANEGEAATVAALEAIAEAMEKAFPLVAPQESRAVLDFRSPERA